MKKYAAPSIHAYLSLKYHQIERWYDTRAAPLQMNDVAMSDVRSIDDEDKMSDTLTEMSMGTEAEKFEKEIKSVASHGDELKFEERLTQG